MTSSMTFKHVRTFLLATAIATGGATYAIAQSAPAPANQSGGGVSATTPAPTDPSASETGNTRGQPARGTMGQNKMDKKPATTGSNAMKSDTMKRDNKAMKNRNGATNVSPSSPQEGVKTEK